jgi:hypothetical protein
MQTNRHYVAGKSNGKKNALRRRFVFSLVNEAKRGCALDYRSCGSIMRHIVGADRQEIGRRRIFEDDVSFESPTSSRDSNRKLASFVPTNAVLPRAPVPAQGWEVICHFLVTFISAVVIHPAVHTPHLR